MSEASQYEPTPRQAAMQKATEDIVDIFGQFEQGSGPEGAHYAAPSPFAADGLVCSNCYFYEGPRGCDAVAGDIDPGGICKLWVIPEELIASSARSMSALVAKALLLRRAVDL